MAPLGNKGMVYITLGMCNTFVPHCDEAYNFVRALNHHQLFIFYVPATRGYKISDMYRLDPPHWTLPAVSKQDNPDLGQRQTKARRGRQEFTAIICNTSHQR